MTREALLQSILSIIDHAADEAKCCGCFSRSAAEMVVDYLATGATTPWEYIEPEDERLEREEREAKERKAYGEAQARIKANRDARASALWAGVDPDGKLRAELSAYGWTIMGISFPCDSVWGDATFAANGETKSFNWNKGQNPLQIALEVASK